MRSKLAKEIEEDMLLQIDGFTKGLRKTAYIKDFDPRNVIKLAP